MKLNRRAAWVGASALLALNVFICWRLFFIEYLNSYGSVEPVFFAIAKAIRARWPGEFFDLGWWAQSNTGMPFTYTYQPLLHHIVAAAAALSGWSEARAYHAVLGLFYAFGPVTFYALVLRLTGNLRASFAGGLLYTLVSPSALLPSIALDMGGAWNARRLYSAVNWGDGPHVAALTLIPLAILFLDRARERRTPASWFLAAIFLASVPLTNIPATIALAMALAAYAMANGWRAWIETAAATLAGCALFAPWLPPSAFMRAAENSQWLHPEGSFTLAKIPYLLGLIAALVIARVLLRRASMPLRFAVLFALLTAAVTIPSEFKVYLLPQAWRFHLVMEMAIILAAVLVIPWTRRATVIALAVLAVIQIGHHRTFARRILQEGDMNNRAEFKAARWIDANAGDARVFAPGATAFWLNYLARQPQVTGCCDQNLLIPYIPIAHYALGTDDGAGDRAAEISTTWLQVLGARYVIVHGPASTEPYKDFHHPGKFEGVLREVWRDGDDVIYEVPMPSASLAHIVREDELIPRLPIHGAEMEPLDRYRAAILDASRPQAEFTWINEREAVVRGTLRPGDLFSLQIPYHPGWEGGSISKDPLGFMVLRPNCEGLCEVRLRYTGGTERLILWIGTGLALLGFVSQFFVWRRLRRRIISGSE